MQEVPHFVLKIGDVRLAHTCLIMLSRFWTRCLYWFTEVIVSDTFSLVPMDRRAVHWRYVLLTPQQGTADSQTAFM